MPEFQIPERGDGPHAKVSPSGMAGLIDCPAKLQFVASLPVGPDRNTKASLRGTACHWLVEQWFDGDLLAGVGDVAPNGYVIDEDMHRDCLACYEAVAALGLAKMGLEVRVPVGKGLGLEDPDICWGTSDVVGFKQVGKTRERHLVDYKFGMIEVDVSTPQGWMYIIGSLAMEPMQPREKVFFHIIQPKLSLKGAPIINTIQYTKAELAKCKTLARRTIKEALGPKPSFGPSEDACRWCEGNGVCKANIDWGLSEFEDLDAGGPLISTDRLAELLGKVKAIKNTIDALEQQAIRALTIGQDVPGYKLVESITRKKWDADTDAILETATNAGIDLDLIAPRTPITPTQALKMSGDFNPIIIKPEGQPTLAPDTDRRPALGPDFENLKTGN